MSQVLLVAHTLATLFMTGVIWFVQVVHYPLMARVGAEGFAAYEAAHTSRTGLVVVAPMLVELATGALLLAAPPPGLPRWVPWVGAALLAAIWLSTFLLQVPAHEILGRGFEPAAHDRLVRSNWLRTGAWSLRAGLVVWLLLAASTAGSGGGASRTSEFAARAP